MANSIIIDQDKLLRALRDARYKVLVACRPLTIARDAFNMTLAELANAIPELANEILAYRLEQ